MLVLGLKVSKMRFSATCECNGNFHGASCVFNVALGYASETGIGSCKGIYFKLELEARK